MDEKEAFEFTKGIAAHNQRNRTNQELAALRQQREQQSRGVCGCPHCGGGLPKIGVSVCMHCQRDLVWYRTVVGKPGQESLCKKAYDDIQKRARAHKASEAEKRDKFLRRSVWIAIPYSIYLFLSAVYAFYSTDTSFFMPLFTVFGMVEVSSVLFPAVAVANGLAFTVTVAFLISLCLPHDGQQ